MKPFNTTLLKAIFVSLICFGGALPANAQTPPVFGPDVFTRHSGAPETVTRSFAVQDPTAAYTLVIQNGDGGTERVSSAIVTLNGTEVGAPNEFTQNTARIIKSVTLNQTNTLTVELRGKPGGSITVSIFAGTPSSVFPRFTLFTNRSDPQLLRAELPGGEVIDYFGEKDKQGFATSLKVVRVEDSSGRQTTLDLDEQGRPVLIHAFNGTLFKLTYQADNSILVTVTSADGLIDIDIPVGSPAQAKARKHHSGLSQGAVPFGSAIRPFALAAQAFAQPTSTINVKNCGVPVNNATVTMQVKTSTGATFTIPGSLTGNGVYQVGIPTPDRSALLRQKQKCLRVAEIIGIACNALSLLGPLAAAICPAITVGVAAIPVAGVAAPAIFVACQASMLALQAYCGTLGLGPDIPGAPDLASLLCEKIIAVIDRASFGPVTLTPTVTIIGEGSRSSVAVAPPDGPFPTFSFNFPCDCQSGLGQRFIAPGGNVRIQILPYVAEFTNEIRLLVRGQTRVLATNTEVGRTVDLGTFAPGTELLFYIHVRDTGLNFFMGPASRNQDGLAHSRLECLGNGITTARFEDFLGGGDLDYDDAVFQIITGP